MINNIKQIRLREQIPNLIKSMDKPIVCEVGVQYGSYFDLICTNNISEAYAVDIWKNTGIISQNDSNLDNNKLDKMYKDLFRKYINNSKVKIIREFSSKAADFFDDEYFDFVYIDADHSYEGCKADLNAWYPKVKKGGVLSGHDYTHAGLWSGHPYDFGVIKAVEEFKKINNINSENFHLTSESYASYYILKK